MKLYTKRSCPYCHRVELALAERKISQDVIHLEQIDFENPAPSFLKINPNKKVPTLEISQNNGFGESMVIVEYLDSIDAVGHKLYGNTAEEIAKTKFHVEMLADKVTSFFLKSTYTFGNKIEEKCLAAQTPLVFAAFEKLLENKTGHFFGGDNLNAQDIHVIPFVLRYAAMSLLRKDWILPEKNTRVGKYFDAVIAHPSVQKCLPGLEEVSTIVKRHTSLSQPVQKIKDSSRNLSDNIPAELEKLNDKFKDARFSWKQAQNTSGPFITCQIQFENDEQVLKAVSSLCELQESSNHHSSFTLNDFSTLTIEVCTHQPKWGVTEMDFAFAEAFTERMKGIFNGK